MFYSTKFYLGNDMISKADEIIIKFTKDHTIAGLLKFLESDMVGDKRIVVDLREADVEDIILNLDIITSNFKVAFLISEYQVAYALDFAEKNVPYFFDILVDNWSELTSLVNMGISDIYISGDLGFDLHRVAECCHFHNVTVRVIPNVAQRSNRFDNLESVYSFWIRPEDLPLMEDYIDIVEFGGDITKQYVYYRIYKDHRWIGDLSDLIVGLTLKNVFSDRMLPYWGDSRAKCNKRCLQGRCAVCSAQVDFARSLLEKENLSIRLIDAHPAADILTYEEYKKMIDEKSNNEIIEDFTQD